MKAAKEESGEDLVMLKDEILERWDKLPPEHQATMLLVLFGRSKWSEWAVEAQNLLEESEGGDRPETHIGFI